MDGLGEALRTTGEGWRERGGVRWSMLDWMDGDRRGGRQRQLQRRPGQRRQQRWRLRGGRRRRRGGEEWAWSRLGDVGSGCARGGFSLSRASRKVGRVSREGGGVAVGGARRRRRVRVRVARKEGSGRDARGSSGWGAAGGGGRVSSGRRTGCCENAGATATQQQRRRGRQDRTGTGSDSIRGGDGIGGFCDTDSNDDRDGEDRDSDDGDSRGRGLSAETWAAIRPSGSKVRLGTKFAIEDSSSDRDDGSNFSDEGDSDSISDDPEQRRQRGPGQQRQRRRQRGRWRVVEGTSRATSERDRTADSNAGWPHRVVRRRFDVDETRTVFGTVREEGAWPGGGHAVGRHFWGVEVSGGAGASEGEGGVGGQAGRHSPVAVGGLFRAESVGKSTSPFSSGLELHD